MDVAPYASALREDLLAAAAAGDESTRRTAALLAGALEPSVRLMLLNAMADLAAEVTEALDDGRSVEVRLDGRQARVVVTEPPGSGSPRATAPPLGDAGDMSRITLRLVEQLKAHAEQAASVQGVSLNSWIAQAVQGALHGQRPGTGEAGRARRRARADERRLRGWVDG